MNGMKRECREWLGRIRESMARLTPEFSASRAIREYTENHYLPAAAGYRERAAGDSEVGASLLQWRRDIARHWNTVRFGKCRSRRSICSTFFEYRFFQGISILIS